MILVVDNSVKGPDGTLATEITSYLSDAELYDYPDLGRAPDLDGVDGVVLAGSEAGVYEVPDRPWIEDQQAFVRDLVDAGVPTLGVCFGHQIVNAALGGEVVDSGVTHGHFVDAALTDDPLFEGVDPVVPVLHSDVVTELGEGMEVIGSADYYEYFATRHVDRPVWTVQFHPEFTDRVASSYEDVWEPTDFAFADATATRTIANFEALAAGDS